MKPVAVMLLAVLTALCMAGPAEAAMQRGQPHHCAASGYAQSECRGAAQTYSLPSATPLPEVEVLIVAEPMLWAVGGLRPEGACWRELIPRAPRSPPVLS